MGVVAVTFRTILFLSVVRTRVCTDMKVSIFNGVLLNEDGFVLSAGGQYTKSRYSSLEKAVFLAAHDENLTWVQDAQEEFGIQFIIFQSKYTSVPNYVPNIGSEACKYAKIFRDYYDNFPQNAMLLHAHEIGNHNGPHRNMSQVAVIESWLRYGQNERWRSAPSTRTYHVRMRPLAKHLPLLEIIAQSPESFGEDPLVSKVVQTSADVKTAKIIWKDKYSKKWPYRTLTTEYYTARNAQFATTSEAVKSHPWKVWDFAYKLCISHLTETGIKAPKKRKKKMSRGSLLQKRRRYRMGAQFETFWKHLLAPGCDPKESYICP